MKIEATDYSYHGAGVFEAWVPLQDVAKICALKGVSHVSMTPKPINNRLMQKLTDRVASAPRKIPAAREGETLNIIGTVFDFGITQHRVDQINQTYNPLAPVDYEGQGISIGAMSNSYDSGNSSNSTTAAQDVASGDLPGTGNAVNPQPVVVLQDITNSTDEGRGMLQTIFKMAPKARLAFATADTGEIGFADNIRALAGLPGYVFDPGTQQGFAADVICGRRQLCR